MDDVQAADAPVYVYKPSLTGSARTFELGAEGLAYRTGFRTGVWRYADIVGVRLSYRPISMLSHRFRADLRHRDGKVLTLISASWTSIAKVTPQDDAYRTFLKALFQRLAASGGTVTYVAGLPPLLYAIATLALALVMIAIAGLMLRAVTTGTWPAALFLLGFALWFGWTIGRWLRLNKPRAFVALNDANDLLP